LHNKSVAAKSHYAFKSNFWGSPQIVVPDMPITESTKNILDDFKTETENINIEVWYVIAK
jgi:hypothetical protein